MEIVDTRHVTPDEYSIEEIRVGYNWSRPEPKYVGSYLSISLKPKGYLRNRFSDGGVSYETKKHGAQQLIIHADEIKQMVEAFSDEVTLCHKLLLEHDLVPELIKARHSKREAAQAKSAAQASVGS